MSVRSTGKLAASLAAAAVAAGCGSSGQQSSVARDSSHPGSAARGTVTTSTAQTGRSTGHTRAHVDQHIARPSAPRSKAEPLSGASTVPGSGPRAGGGTATISPPKSPATVKAPKPPVIQAGALIAGLSGSGSEAIGALSEKTSVVLEWRTAAPPIQIFNAHGFLLVNSNLPNGRIRLARGQYRGMHVGAKGPWTIKIHASA